MKILGIDPALTSLGWGIIEISGNKVNYINSGLLKTNNKKELYLRISDISTSIEQVISLYKPNIVAMEETFININAISSLKLAYVRGALMALFGKNKLPYYEFLPNKIKKTVVGVGHAEKSQIKHMMSLILTGVPKDICFDEADALATAYTCSVLNNSIV